MKNGLTELVFILDRSGSMANMTEDTIGGFNTMIARQKESDGTAYVSTVLFNQRSRVLHDRVDLKDVPPMTHKDYMAGGMTALLDAVGDAIRFIGNVHKYARPEDVPEHTLFVITTDGMENASHKYTVGDIRRMISRQQEKYGWEFLFLGANIDAVSTAESYGIRRANAANFHNDSRGIATNYEALSDAVECVRASRPLSEGWKDKIDEDYISRK